MSKSLLNKKFTKKKNKAIQIRIKSENMKDEVIADFIKLVKIDYINDMEIVIERNQVSTHKNTIKKLKEKYCNDNLELKDITAFERLDEIYYKDICDYKKNKV